jgi:fructose 1,6-bisphosphatase
MWQRIAQNALTDAAKVAQDIKTYGVGLDIHLGDDYWMLYLNRGIDLMFLKD